MKTPKVQSNSIFTSREVIEIELPILETRIIDHPEKVILRVDCQTFDVGSLCYFERSPKPRARAKPTLVNEKTLIASRRLVVEKIIRFASLILIGKRGMTVIGMLNAIKSFIDFADRRGLKDIFDCGESSERGFAEFAGFIYESYRRGEIGPERAQQVQSHVLKWFKSLTANNNFASEVRLVSLKASQVKEETVPADENAFSHLLAMSHMIFNGLTDFLLNEDKFPFKLNLPNSLSWPTGNHLWIFPTSIWNLPPRYWGDVRMELGSPGWSYDYENGRINTWEEIWPLFKGADGVKKRRAKNTLANSIKLIESANANPMHYRRLHLAKLALKAFIFLFFSNTGVNPSVLSKIETEDEIEANVVNQSYRAIKYRANGLEVTVRVPASFMPDLRKFMALRKFILNGHFSSLLFFRFDVFNHSSKNIKPLSREPLSELFRTLKDIDPKISPINPRQIRVTFNDWHLRKYEVPVVAKIMGHSEKTENTKYGRGSPITHQQEMTEFLEMVEQSAKSQKVSFCRPTNEHVRALEQGGSCSNFGNPQGMLDNSLVQPNCKNNCWYCVNRQLVIDEIDVRKLASAIFVMEQFINTPEQEKSLRPFIQKCESDLELIGKTGNCNSMVEKIKSEVFEKGRLSTYWAMKYNHLLELSAMI